MNKEKNNDSRKAVRVGIFVFTALVIAALFMLIRSCVLDRLASGEEEKRFEPVGLYASYGNFEISVDGVSFSEGILIDESGSRYRCLSGGEWLTREAPNLLPENATAYQRSVSGDGLAFSDGEKKLTDADGGWLSLAVSFRTSETLEIFLDSTSFVAGAEKIISAAGEYERPAGENGFSRDAAAGAIRVAFVELDGGEEKLRNVWIPNDGYRVSQAEGKYSFEYNAADAERESATGYGYSLSGEKSLYGISEYGSGLVSIGEEQLAKAYTLPGGKRGAVIGQSTPLLSFKADGSRQTKTLLIRIWYESTDREAAEILKGGISCLSLKFAGVDKKTPDIILRDSDGLNYENAASLTEAENERYVYFNNRTDKLCFFTTAENYINDADEAIDVGVIIYSFDGIAWEQYSYRGDSKSVFWKPYDQTVYVRLAETATRKPGDIIKITIPAVSYEDWLKSLEE